MHRQILLLLLTLVGTLSACTKEESGTTASLEITCVDEEGQPIGSNGFVKLYATVEDWSYDRLAVADPHIPDASGRVLFVGLEPRKYYWRAESLNSGNCSRNNYNDRLPDMSLTEALVAGQKTSVTATLSPKGSYVIDNLSRDSYRLFIDGAFVQDISSRGSAAKTLQQAGARKVRLLQITGVSGTALDTSFNLRIACGELTQVHFNP